MTTTTITIPDVRAASLNEVWRQGFWRKRQALALAWRSVVRSAIDPNRVQAYDVPVHITVTAYYKRNPVDCDNVLVKPIIDALKGWHIPDDDPRYVASVRMISRKADSDHIVIVLEPEGIKPRYQQNAKKPWHVDVQYKPRQRWALLEECETPEQARARVLELGREDTTQPVVEAEVTA